MFYLGTHEPAWLKRLEVPLFISRVRLARRKSFPQALGRWALDSGGFTQLHKHGRWNLSVADYVSEVRRYANEIGNLDWVAPQDWMCEPTAREMTGLSVARHQELTVENFLELRDALGMLVIPVLQGWDFDDYGRCVDLYHKHDVCLEEEPVIGLGSVCRRDSDRQITQIIEALYPLNLHAFGVKGKAYVANEHLLTSADSMAWSYQARRNPPLPECAHRCCNNCAKFALAWRQRLLDRTNQMRLL
jgi:hypothetical protein